MENRRHYLKVLDLPDNANQADIRKAYRKLAKQFHPDVNQSPNANQQFEALRTAYMALSRQLSDPNPPTKPNKPSVKKTQNAQNKAQMRQAFMAKAQARSAYQDKLELQEFLQSRVRKFWRIFGIINLCLGLLLIIDHSLPTQGFYYTGRFEELHNIQLI